MNLEKGQVVKNYKALCSILEQKECGGKSKQLQIKDWQRFFSYHKDGQKFIIDEIYDIPKEKIDGRVSNGANKAKYDTLMDNIILNQLSSYLSIEASKGELYRDHIMLFSKDYDELFLDTEQFAEKHSLGIGITSEYLSKINSIVTNCTHTALNRLQKQRKIEWALDTLIRANPANDYYADEDMVKLVKEKETLAYEEMNIKPFARANMRVNKKFKKLVCDYLTEDTIYSIYNYWKVYNISLNDTKNLLDYEEDIEELKRRLAISICDSVKNKKMTNKKDEIFYPYTSEKYKEQLKKLNEFVFGIKYQLTEDEIEEAELIKLFGSGETTENISITGTDDTMYYLSEQEFPF